MATLDDKLLGEKLQYYCSSSESEAEEDDDAGEKLQTSGGVAAPSAATSASSYQWRGSSSNTGPKGVVHDYQRFKQLEQAGRLEQKAELEALSKKFSMTCRTQAEDAAANEDEALDRELSELLGDDLIQQFVQQRMKEMVAKKSNRRTYGAVLSLKDGAQFLMAVDDDQEKDVNVLVLLYEPNAAGCSAALKALDWLARRHRRVKFCTARPSSMAMSADFGRAGVPALLSYRAGQLTGNFVQLGDDLGVEFDGHDLEAFLVERGILDDVSLMPPGLSSGDPIHSDSDDEY